jgi:cytoskeletal protein RodZ
MNRQTISTVLLIVILGAIGYIWFYYFQPVSNEKQETQANYIKELRTDVVRLRKIKAVKLDTTVFQDSFFQSLQAPLIPIVSTSTTGRRNPFIPF